MAEIEVIISDGPLAGNQGYTVEEPTGQAPWPDAEWEDDAGTRYRYVFKEMSNAATNLPVYHLSPK